MAGLLQRMVRLRSAGVAGVVVVLVVAFGALVHHRHATGPGRPLAQLLAMAQVQWAQDRLDGGNPVTLVAARRYRDHRLCSLLRPTGRHVHDWLGTVHDISTSKDDGSVKVSLGDGVDLHTDDDDRFRPGTAIFDSVAKLHDGDQVWFSGRFVKAGDGKTCLRSTNLFARTGVTSPDFVFRFSSVGAAG